MLSESRTFLFDHGYEGIKIRGYTSKTRDVARAKLGLAPLKDLAADRDGLSRLTAGI